VIPFAVLLVTWGAFRLAGELTAWERADSWQGSLCFVFAAMFAFTAVSHFHPKTRPDLIRMVPPGLPSPSSLVTLTGVLELGGAIGLLWPGTASIAALSLIALLIAMFPANVYAARNGIGIGGRGASALWWRLPLQLFWIFGLWWSTGA
jgi:uncharacterized membrane protein